MIDLAICSFFKDSQTWGGININQVDRYFNQLASQEFLKDIDWKIFAIEGCSKDLTLASLELRESEFALEIIPENISANSPVQSTAAHHRLKNLNDLGNVMLDKVKGEAKMYLWLESDLIIPDNLVESLYECECADIVAPIVTWQTKDVFYDLWGFVNPDGTEWSTTDHIKYQAEYEEKRWKEMNSIGSCALINGEIINSGLNFGNNCFRGLCENARNKGFKIAVDTHLRICHPSQYFVDGRLV